MKQHRTTYGTTTYIYKGVDISKWRDDWSFRVEHMISQTGNFSTEYVYGSYRLTGVPARVNEYLANERYILEEATGVFRLTEAYKAELREGARQRHREVIAETEASIIEAVNAKDWREVSDLSTRLLDYTRRYEWALNTEEAVA